MAEKTRKRGLFGRFSRAKVGTTNAPGAANAPQDELPLAEATKALRGLILKVISDCRDCVDLPSHLPAYEEAKKKLEKLEGINFLPPEEPGGPPRRVTLSGVTIDGAGPEHGHFPSTELRET